MDSGPTGAADRWALVGEILERAFDCAPEALDALLAEACGSDVALDREVRTLLRAAAAAPSFLDGDALGFASPALEGADDAPGGDRRIGPWRLVREIGRGGMGAVYLAERADGDFQQTVAIKLIRSDLDTAAVERRFRRERRILAGLEHPNIARLLDGGATPDGTLYFVMEHVPGTSLLEHCARGGVSVEERLRLFAHACEAVQHAHRNLVVHRDLKPSNILVTAEGRVKLLDFGIAKLLLDEDGATNPGPATRLGLQPMTPEYASPEQLRGHAITTASDVYSLGVVLYELLTGEAPYPTAHRSAAELERVVSQHVPLRPSEARTKRGGRVGGRGPIPPDLDAIVLAALKKEPDERYPSATELLEDIRRYLGGFPVSARDDSTRYRMARFVARNRVAVGVGALALLSLVGGLIGTSVQARIAARERDERQLEAERARAVADFAVGLFDMVDPQEAQGRAVTVEDLVAAGLERVDALEGQPAEQAMFLDVMARVSAAAGEFGRADSLFHRAVALKEATLGPDDPSVAESLLGLGTTLMMQNRLEEAENALDRARRIQLATFGAADPRALRYQTQLGFAHHTLGDRERAEALLRDVLAREAADPRLRDHPEIVEARYALGRVLDYYGDHEEAEGYLRDVLARREAEHGPNHSETADVAFALARSLTSQRKLDEAAERYGQAHRVYARVYGEESVYTTMSVYSLAQVQHRRGALEEAERGYRAAAELYGAQPSSALWEAFARVALGQVLVLRGRHAEAERELGAGLDLYRAGPTVDPEQVAVAESWLGRVLGEQGRFAEAEALLLGAHRAMAEHAHMARQTEDAAAHLAALYRAWDRPDEARRWEARPDADPGPSEPQ